MKKRIALAAAIALAISVGGMVPASATKLGAPVVGASVCARAGGTLELKAKDGNITVDLKGTAGEVNVDWTGNVEGVDPTCAAGAKSLTGLTEIIVKATEEDSTGAEGNVTIDLEGLTTGTLANFGSIPMKIQAAGTLKFDGSLLVDSGHELRPVIGTVTEESFVLGTVTGAYYAGKIEFAGGKASDSFDASAVATTNILAVGNDGNDTLKGGAGNDSLTGSAGDDKLFGNAGDDTLNTSDGGSCTRERTGKGKSPDKCLSGLTPSGADEAWGGAGLDTIASDAADVVAPGDGADSISGAAFQLYYGDSSAAISLNLDTADGVVRSTAGDDFYPAASVAVFVGSPLADTMIGSDSGDSLYGLEGADKILGGLGADVIGGGGGTDAIKGGKGADELFGDTGADLINGGADDDVIWMGGGDDISYGSAGNDTLRGQKGSDQAWGGKGTFDVCAAEVTDSCEFMK